MTACLPVNRLSPPLEGKLCRAVSLPDGQPPGQLEEQPLGAQCGCTVRGSTLCGGTLMALSDEGWQDLPTSSTPRVLSFLPLLLHEALLLLFAQLVEPEENCTRVGVGF